MSVLPKPRPSAEKEARVSTTPRGERKREQILHAAAKVLAARGYVGATLTAIAEEAGTQAGSIYYHFTSREELIEEVLLRGVALSHAHSRAALGALPAGSDAASRLGAALQAHLCFQVEVSDYARAAARSTKQVPPDMQVRINSEFRAYGRFFDRLIGAAMREGFIDSTVDRSALRMLIIGAANWTPEWYRPDGDSSANEIADLLVRLVFKGVA
jgi:TetR/AcrR family transcriptional regulator, cholesterol catabolism regulator